MYDPDRIFGPFSTAQAVILVVGYGAFYLLDRFYMGDALYFKIAVIAIGAALLFRLRPRRIKGDLVEYLRKKYPSDVDFTKALQRKRAEVMSQIAMRKERGQAPDPILDAAFETLDQFYPKANQDRR